MNCFDYILPSTVDGPVALIDGKDVAFSFGQIRQGVDGLAGYVAQTTHPQDRCVLLAENSFFGICAYLAILKAGRIAVPLPASASESLLDKVWHDCSPSLFFVDRANLARSLEAMHRRIPFISDGLCENQSVMNFRDLIECAPLAASSPIPDDRTSLASLMYTSGSTGEPRGVMVSHRNIIANTESIVQYMGLTPEDRVMDVLPLSYCFGASLLHSHFHVGGSLVIDNGLRWIELMLTRMARHACTGFAGVPATYQLLLRKSSFPRKQFPHLRWLQQAGGKLPKLFLDELRQLTPDKRLYVMYGQTEATARLSYLPPEMLDAKIASIGKGIPGTRLEVIDDIGRPVNPGATGEIVAEGDNITLGYWHNPEETRSVFRNKRLYTGDLATVDEDGFIYILGRSREFLKLGGIRISAVHIEETICSFAGTRELAIVGKDDEREGETIVLFISHPKGEDIRVHLQEFCNHKLPLNQRPSEIHFVDQLPHNASGKIDRYALRQKVSRAISLPLQVASANQLTPLTYAQ